MNTVDSKHTPESFESVLSKFKNLESWLNNESHESPEFHIYLHELRGALQALRDREDTTTPVCSFESQCKGESISHQEQFCGCYSDKLQSLTTERDEALKANDLLCEKIDKKDKEIDVLNRRVKLLKAVLNSQSKEQ
jgi:hypothetical protein